jgi:hypothetical protein
MTRLFGSILAAMLALAVPAMAAAQSERIRGTIESVDQNSMTVQTSQGAKQIALNDATKYVTVVKSSLANVATGSFIGTATTKGRGDVRVALEVAIFPPSLRGTGEGSYDWDKLPDTTMARGGSVSSSMTNGTVETTSSSPSAKVNSRMTNGAVQSSVGQGGAKRITVTYNGTRQTILVPPTAAIVAFQPAERPAVMAGAHVFIRASEDGGKATADFVAVGQDGLTPPM